MQPREKKHTGGPGPRPAVWLSGPDDQRHRQWIAFGRARCQARFRGEDWSLTFQDWEELWQGCWHLRGRHSQDLCLCRQDYSQGWHRSNVDLITHLEHNRRQKAWKLRHG